MISILTLIALSASYPAETPSPESLSLLAELAPLEENSAADPAWFAQEGVKDQEPDETPFSYTFLEVGATRFDVDNFDEKADIYYGRAQLGLLKYLYIFGGYENQATDFEDTSTDLFRAGVGGHLPVGARVDLVGDVAWLWSNIDSDLDELDDTNTGAEFHLGGRWMPVLWDGGGLEVHGGGVYVDLKDRLASDDEALGWEAGLKVHFLRMLGGGAVYTMLEDDYSVGVNARVSF